MMVDVEIAVFDGGEDGGECDADDENEKRAIVESWVVIRIEARYEDDSFRLLEKNDSARDVTGHCFQDNWHTSTDPRPRSWLL